MLKNKYFSFILISSYLIVPSPSYSVLLMDTGEEHEIIDARARNAAAPYEQVCRLKINDSETGSGTLIGRKGREIYVLTAAHCVWNSSSKTYHGLIDLIFNLKDNRQITCPALSSYIPRFGPTTFFNQKEPNSNNDIAVLKCLLPDDEDFDVEPMLLGDSELGPINRYEGKFLGYGTHGINGSKPRDLDGNRRLGQTYFIEYRQDPIWSIMSILPVMDDKLSSFEVSYNALGKIRNIPFGTKLEMKDDKLTYNNDISSWVSPYASYVNAPTMLTEYIHPQQSRIMGGDSGGPLFISQKGTDVIIGVTACHSHTGGMYYDNFTPVSCYKKWRESILEGTLPKETDHETLTPNMNLGLFSDTVFEFTTTLGVKGMFNGFIKLHILDQGTSNQIVHFDEEQDVLKIDDASFEFRNLKSPEELLRALIKSGLFEDVTFGEKELPVEALGKVFFKKIDSFMEKMNQYPEDFVKKTFEKAHLRLSELKEKGLIDEEFRTNFWPLQNDNS